MSKDKRHFDRELDLENKKRGVWLVKLPKYIAKRWAKAPGDVEVGKLKIKKATGKKTQVSLSLSSTILNIQEDGEEPIPKDYVLDVSYVNEQTLAVFSQSIPDPNAVIPDYEKLAIEGVVTQKLDCRPPVNNTYMNLKLQSIKKAAEPTRKVQQLEKVVNAYKPIADHKSNIEYNQRKKAEGKMMRGDRDVVMDMLFNAFEKHQYYNIRDLVKITKQPITYLKEILNEVCNYNMKSPHKNMWELKPEYRHYKKPENEDEDMDD